MSIILIIFQACLSIYLLALAWFILGLLRQDPPRTDHQPTVAVIVAARNGSPHLPRLVEQLLSQDYPHSRLEILVVDDGLSGLNRTILQDLSRKHTHLRVVPSSDGDAQLAQLKRANDAGIQNSRGELLLFTAGDCQVGAGWVDAMVSYFLPEVDYVVGWSEVAADFPTADASGAGESSAPFRVFEQLDFFILMLAARGAALMGTHWACSGQNQAYRRSLYEGMGGFSALAHRLQGDDSIFLQLARKRANARVTFAIHPRSQVVTAPSESLQHFLYQRIRWAADALAMWRYNPAFLPIPVATFGANALILVLAGTAMVNAATVLPVLLPGILLKVAVEAAFLWIGTAKLDRRGLGRHFLLWFVFQWPYITLVGLGSFLGNRLRWRLRTVETSA